MHRWKALDFDQPSNFKDHFFNITINLSTTIFLINTNTYLVLGITIIYIFHKNHNPDQSFST